MKKQFLNTMLILTTISFISLAHANNSKQNSLQIGEYYQGGVIYWLDPAQQYEHGLLADIRNQPTLLEWDIKPPLSTNAFGNKVYSGKNRPGGNTYIILHQKPLITAPAAQACANSIAQGYADWYLPSLMEITMMYRKRLEITQTSVAYGGSGFGNTASDSYWSSTENDAFGAWDFHFINGGTQSLRGKDSALGVRCIRAF